jgi:hypothetical protein
MPNGKLAAVTSPDEPVDANTMALVVLLGVIVGVAIKLYLLGYN